MIQAEQVTIAELIKNEKVRVAEFGAVAQILAQVGEYDRLLALAETVGDEKNKAEMLCGIALALTYIACSDKALEVVFTIKNNRRKATILSAMTQAMTKNGHQEQALQVLQTSLAIARLVDRECVYEVLEGGATTLSMIDQGRTLWGIL